MKTVRHTRSALTLVLLGTFAAQSAWAGCRAPATPKSLPDGRKAEKAVMLEAKREVDHYTQQVSAYMSCENDGRKLQEVKALQKAVTDRFNAEVRAFNAVNRD